MTLYCAYIMTNLFVASPQCEIKTPPPKAYNLHTKLPMTPRTAIGVSNPVRFQSVSNKTQLPKVSFSVGFTMRF